MANTKQISQLNPAASVNSTDQLPLAQQGSSEAVRATVSQLAQAVGELNETGAYSELTLATSIGKNILAQRLTEKGIQTSPTETLIQMADKLNTLQVLNSASLGMSNLVIASTDTDVTAGNVYGRFHATRMKNGYTAIVAAGKIYICETEGDYSSLSDFINSAIASINQTNASASNNRAYIAASEDGSKLATYDYNGHIDIYSVDYENEEITYASTVDASGTYGAASLQLAINNAGTFVAYFYSWDSTFRIQSVVDDTKVVTFSIYSSQSYSGNGGLTFDNTDPNVLYSVTLNNTDYNDQFYTSKITYDFSSSTPTATVETIIKNLKGSFDPYNKLVINTASVERPQNNNNLIKLNFNVYDLVREQSTNTVSCIFNVDAMNGAYNNPAYIGWSYGLSWTYTGTVNGELIYKCHQPKLTLKYNPSTNTIVLEGADYQVFQFSANSPLVNSSSTYPAYLLAYDQDMNKLVLTHSNTMPYYLEYGIFQYVRYCALSSDSKLLGLISKDSSGNLRTLYYMSNYLIADVLAGKYDLDTTIPYLS